MSDEVAPDAVVSYKVGDLLSEIKGVVDQIDKKVDGKADKTDLVPLVAELKDHHVRLQTLEDAAKAAAAIASALRSRRRFVAGVFTAVIVPISATLLYIFH